MSNDSNTKQVASADPSIESYDLPPEIAIALQANRPEFVMFYIRRSDPGPMTEMARLIGSMIMDRINQKHEIEQLKAVRDALKERLDKVLTILTEDGYQIPG